MTKENFKDNDDYIKSLSNEELDIEIAMELGWTPLFRETEDGPEFEGYKEAEEDWSPTKNISDEMALPWEGISYTVCSWADDGRMIMSSIDNEVYCKGTHAKEPRLRSEFWLLCKMREAKP